MSNYNQFLEKLREIFMMDHAELDFGIYRIMNQKREEITKFLEKDLLPQVKKILGSNNSDAAKTLQQELDKAVKQCEALRIDPNTSMTVIELREQIAASSASNEELENEVFNHLTIFFSRYYDNGDFVSKRRYKDNAYAIPYNGEEVKLHWANSDQYYIKTSEYFQNYTFNVLLDDNTKKKVHFVLKDVTTEQNNNKAASGMERRFALYQDEETASIEVIQNEDGEDELNIYFTYELMPKGTKQDALMAAAFDCIKTQLPADFSVLITTLCPTEKLKKRTLLEKHLTDYTAKNSFDYFIHKDLGGFLRRELDFYIKNEVLLIDDLDEKHVMQQLNQVRAIKGVGEKIITMLAQIEDFQKRLWLKKKFVVQSDYCITLDRVPESFYPEICENEKQRKEWEDLFAIKDLEGYKGHLTLDFLCNNRYLVLDTVFFSPSFKHRLQSKMEDVDKNCNGLLINSENFQALELLQSSLRKSINCNYIDPPYNAKSSEILYKNTFKHSSWLSLMYDRLLSSKALLSSQFTYVVAIDEIEQEVLGQIISDVFPDNKKVCVSVVHNPRGQQGKNISYKHEFAYMVYPSDSLKCLSDIKRPEIDSRNLRDSGTESDRTDAATCFYPFICKNGEIIRIGEVPSDDFHPLSNNVHNTDGTVSIWPIDDNGKEKKWRYNVTSVAKIRPKLEIKQGRNSLQVIFNQDMGTMPSLWNESKYDASEYGTKVLQHLFGIDYIERYGKNLYPKSLYNVLDCISIGLNEKEDGRVIDFFGGSGTTGHAVISLNRISGSRTYSLVEMGRHFDSILLPRIKKVIYSEDWKDGKPVSRKGISQCFKYMRLEQYEDTLNNLEVKKKGDIFGGDEDFHESYMLQYMMDMETRDSLINIERFVHPFDVKLKTTRDNELVETTVDMVETFNYLIGLEVDSIRWTHNDEICVVEGRLHRNQDKALIIWRDTEKVNNAELNDFFRRNDYHVKDSEFDVIYVNGDNTLQNQKRDDEHWKVVLIEEEFQEKMFEGDK